VFGSSLRRRDEELSGSELVADAETLGEVTVTKRWVARCWRTSATSAARPIRRVGRTGRFDRGVFDTVRNGGNLRSPT
jgi:hypothetical protein